MNNTAAWLQGNVDAVRTQASAQARIARQRKLAEMQRRTAAARAAAARNR